MNDERKTKKQLIAELEAIRGEYAELRQHVAAGGDVSAVERPGQQADGEGGPSCPSRGKKRKARRFPLVFSTTRKRFGAGISS